MDKVPWARFFGEAVLIVASVYLAILLDGVAQDRARRAEAIEALTVLKSELLLDRTDSDQILELQRIQSAAHERIGRWLFETAEVPVDSFAAAVTQTLYRNRTLFPRKSSWTTMVAGGQLIALDAPDLVRQMANLYEHSTVRLEYNGERYDDTTQDILRVHLPTVWDRVREQFLTSDRGELYTFGNRMYQARQQNENYVRLVEVWTEELDAVLAAVNAYLDQVR